MRHETIPIPKRISNVNELRDLIFFLSTKLDAIEHQTDTNTIPIQLNLTWEKKYEKDRTCKECGNLINVWSIPEFVAHREQIGVEWMHDGISYQELLLRYPISRRRLTFYLDSQGIPSRSNKLIHLPKSPRRKGKK